MHLMVPFACVSLTQKSMTMSSDLPQRESMQCGIHHARHCSMLGLIVACLDAFIALQCKMCVMLWLRLEVYLASQAKLPVSIKPQSA